MNIVKIPTPSSTFCNSSAEGISYRNCKEKPDLYIELINISAVVLQLEKR